jgi:integrase
MQNLQLIEHLATHPSPGLFAAHQAARGLIDSLEHTVNHIDCPACNAADEVFRTSPNDVAAMAFADAGDFWLKKRKRDPNLKPRALESISGSVNALKKYFDHVLMMNITAGMIAGYQEARMTNNYLIGAQLTHPWQKPAGNSAINHDCSVLSQMLDYCKCWARIAPEYYPMHVKGWSPRLDKVFPDGEEEEFFARLSGCEDETVKIAFWCALVTSHTTACGTELRGLRIENVHLEGPGGTSTIYIPEDAVKNNSRPRRIVLNDVARFAIANLMARAYKLGACEPTHFVFPYRLNRDKTLTEPDVSNKKIMDPTRRASRSFLRRSWDKLREVTGRPDLTPHMLRHLCITRLLETGSDDSTVLSIAGHVTRKMLVYYSQHRNKVKAEAVKRIDNPNVIPMDQSKSKSKSKSKRN